MTLVLLLLVATGQAQPRDERAQVQRALIAEALRGDVPTAVSRYQQLVRTLADDDPLWRLAVQNWARALYDDGRVSEARGALRMMTRKGLCEADCQALLQHIAIDQESIRTVPVTWSFDNENPGLFHHWTRQDQGELVARPASLRWTTLAELRPPDQLLLGFVRPQPPPEVVTFVVRSVATPSLVRMVLRDEGGQRFVTPATELAPGLETLIVAELGEVVGESPTARLDARRLSRVALEDLTGTRRPGAHTIEILSFSAE